MLKAIGSIQLALATIYVVPAVTGQDAGVNTLEAQLDATLSSLHYLAGLRSSAQAGDPGSMRAIIAATEEPREATPQRTFRLQTLRDDISKLRYSLDRLLADPSEVQAITSLPGSVLRTLGLGGGEPTVPDVAPRATTTAPATTFTPNGLAGLERPASTGAPMGTNAAPPLFPPDTLTGTAPTTGLSGSLHATIQRGVGPIDGVSHASRRRGDETLDLEGADYVADAVRLGKLLVRADRAAEAIEVLKRAERTPATRYWLARAYQAQDRLDEALEMFIMLAEDDKAGEYKRRADRDRDFLQFEREFRRGQRSSRANR